MVLPRAQHPRFPTSQDESDAVWKRWDRLNGRYYYVADVILKNGRIIREVTFDKDTNIAVEIVGSRVPRDLFDAEVRECIIPSTEDF